jgi:hypothetical protein
MPAAVKLSICAIASEVVPFAKTGGLADVASALSRQLTARGHDVRLFMPFYAQIKRDNLEATRVESLQGLRILVGRHEYSVDIWRTRLPGSASGLVRMSQRLGRLRLSAAAAGSNVLNGGAAAAEMFVLTVLVMTQRKVAPSSATGAAGIV